MSDSEPAERAPTDESEPREVEAEAARLLASMERLGLSLAAAYLSMSLDALHAERTQGAVPTDA